MQMNLVEITQQVREKESADERKDKVQKKRKQNWQKSRMGDSKEVGRRQIMTSCRQTLYKESNSNILCFASHMASIATVQICH